MTILQNLEDAFQAGPQTLYDMDILNGTGLTITSAEYQTLCNEVNGSSMPDEDKDQILLYFNYKGRVILIDDGHSEAQE